MDIKKTYVQNNVGKHECNDQIIGRYMTNKNPISRNEKYIFF
jgi:hypothetical protein